MDFILQWIDFIWLPVIVAVVHKKQRLLAAGMFFSCALMMRLQIELITSTGFETGFLPFMTSGVQSRGLAVYSIFYMIYTLLAFYSPRTKKPVFLAASITIFFAALVVSMIVMLL